MPDLRLAVIEQLGVPIRLISLLAGRRVLAVGTVEPVQPLVQILDVMRMYQIHDHGQVERMGASDESLEFLRRSETRRRGEKTRYVVTETAVIGMFGHSHQLHCIVSRPLDARQHVAGKFGITADPLLLDRHAYMAFVNVKRRKIADIETVARPIERLRIPELRREILRRVVLHHATRIGGNTLVPAVFAMHEYLVQGAMFQAPAPIAVIKENTPHTVGSPGQRQAAPLPTVEVTEQKHLPCPQPLAEPPSVRLLVALETEIQVSIGIVGDTFRRLFYLLQGIKVQLPAIFQFAFDRFQPRVVLYYLQSFRHLSRTPHESGHTANKVRLFPCNTGVLTFIFNIFVIA